MKLWHSLRLPKEQRGHPTHLLRSVASEVDLPTTVSGYHQLKTSLPSLIFIFAPLRGFESPRLLVFWSLLSSNIPTLLLFYRLPLKLFVF